MFKARSIASRLLITSLLVVILSLSVAGWVISNTFESTIRADMDTRLRVMLDTMIGVSELDSSNMLRFGQPVLDQRFDEPLSGFYWQISTQGESAFRSRSLWDQELSTNLTDRSLTGRYLMVSGPEGQQLRLLEQDIILPDTDRLYRFMVAVTTDELDESIYLFDRTLKWAMGLIALTIIISVMVQGYLVLKPLRAIGRRLKDVRAGRRNQIDGQFPREIEPLANEINALLTHNETLLARARTHVGNLAHALKTPLSVIVNAAGSMTDKQQAEVLKEQAAVMQAHVDHHLKRARVSGRMIGSGAPVKPLLDKLVHAMQVIFQDSKVSIEAHCPPLLIFAGEAEDLTEVVGNLLENACKYGQGKVRMTADSVVQSGGMGRSTLRLTVEDNGPGVSQQEQETIFDRGARLDTKVKGSGLGLSIVRDVVDLYGGGITVGSSEMGGLKVQLTLPAIEQE